MFKSQVASMSTETASSGADASSTVRPRVGRVSEVCQEWMVREDGALAYRLQDEEIAEHYTGNKHRNQTVREDVPHAKHEQEREQRLAEQAAAVYHRMLQEQEENDVQIARELAAKLEWEERQKRCMQEARDAYTAAHLQHRRSGVRLSIPPPLTSSSRAYNNAVEQAGTRQGETEPYSEPINSLDLNSRFEQRQHAYDHRKLQEEKDAKLAKELQEQDASLEQRDRQLAMEAQDQELARMLQDRERIKARRAREKAKQRALAKKQQLNDDICSASYSDPIDSCNETVSDVYVKPHDDEEDGINYSLPMDNVAHKVNQLNLRPPVIRINKPRFPDPPPTSTENLTIQQHINIAMAIDPTYPKRGENNTSSSEQLVYTGVNRSPPNTVVIGHPKVGKLAPLPNTTEITGSSSDGCFEAGEPSSAPPYMPIQGQRRTASLEKKHKKKGKDAGGCKQQ